MAGSTLITDYLGEGTHAARPTSPSVPTGGTAIYYETDTTNTFAWSGSAWVQINGTGGGGVTAAIVQHKAVDSASNSGVTFTSAPTAGNILLAIIGKGTPTINTAAGWAIIGADAGGTTETTVAIKVVGIGESATQNFASGAAAFAAVVYEISGATVAVGLGASTYSDATGTTHTVTPLAQKPSGFIIGYSLSEATSDLPASFSSGVVGDDTAANGTSSAVQGFHLAITATGPTAVSSTYTPSINVRFCALYVG